MSNQDVAYHAELPPCAPVKRTNDSKECSSNKRPKTTTEHDICQETVKQEEYFKLEIGNQCYVVASRFKRQLWIHIRVYGIRESDLTTYPTKKGIALSLAQWKILREQCVSWIDQAIVDYRNGKDADFALHLGDNVHLTLEKDYPPIRIITNDRNGTHHIHSGVALNFDQWDKLKQAMTVVHGLLERELDNVDTSKDPKNQRDLWNQLQLTDAQLDTVVRNPSIMLSCAMDYSKQDDFGLTLGLTPNDVYCVKADYPYSTRAQCFHLLQMWYGRNGKRATLRRLVEVLDECLKEGHVIDTNKLKLGIKAMFV